MHLVIAEPDAGLVTQRLGWIKPGRVALNALIDCDPLTRRRFVENPLLVAHSAASNAIKSVPVGVGTEAAPQEALLLIARQHGWPARTAGCRLLGPFTCMGIDQPETLRRADWWRRPNFDEDA